MTDTAETRALQVAMRSYPGMTINGEGVVALGEAIAQAIRDACDAKLDEMVELYRKSSPPMTVKRCVRSLKSGAAHVEPVKALPDPSAPETPEIRAQDVVITYELFSHVSLDMPGNLTFLIAQAIRKAEAAVHASYRDDAPITSADVMARRAVRFHGT